MDSFEHAAPPVALSWLPIGLRAHAARVRTWSMPSALALTDQGLISGANFLLNLLLARWLAPQDYGIFAVAFTVFLVLNSFHEALVLEPLSVLSASHSPSRLNSYFSRQLRIQFGWMLAVASVLVGVATGFLLLRGSSSLANSLFACALFIPCLFLQSFTRRVAYVAHRPAFAAASSSLYAFVLFVGPLTTGAAFTRSPALPLLWIGFAALASSCLLLLLLRRFVPFETPEANLSLTHLLSENWAYGRWLAVTSVFSASAAQLQTILTAGLLNLDAAGTLRAMQLPMLLMAQTITALAVLFLPRLAHKVGEGNFTALRRNTHYLSTALVALALSYALFLWLFAPQIERILFSGKYATASWLIPLLGLVPVFSALTVGFSLALRASRRPQHYLLAALCTAPISAASAVLLIPRWGLPGAAVSIVLNYAVGTVVTYLLYSRWVPSGDSRI